jgi:hypothetical protein
VDKLFKLLKVVVDVWFKLLIDKIELVDKLYKSDVNAKTDILFPDDTIVVVVFCVDVSWMNEAIY